MKRAPSPARPKSDTSTDATSAKIVSCLTSPENALATDTTLSYVSALPDVVVLDLDKPDTPGIVGRITANFPAVRVVACSSEHPRMQVYPARHYGEYYSRNLEPEELAAAVQS